MARGSKKPKVADNAEVPISAMIDVVFLLIIFFVVTAAVDKEVEDEKVILAEAPHGKPVTKKEPHSIVINVRDDGTLTMGMLPVSMSQISNALREAASSYGVNIPIIIRADANAQHYYVKQVMKAVTDTGLYRVKINAMIEQ